MKLTRESADKIGRDMQTSLDDGSELVYLNRGEMHAVVALCKHYLAAPASTAPSEDDASLIDAATYAKTTLEYLRDNPDDHDCGTVPMRAILMLDKALAQRQLARPPLGDEAEVRRIAENAGTPYITDNHPGIAPPLFHPEMRVIRVEALTELLLAQRPPLGSPQGDAVGDAGEDSDAS